MPSFDLQTFQTLAANLVTGEADLAAKTQASIDAQTAAATAQAAASQAQATNRANVTAIKQYADSLDADGNSPDPAPPIADTTRGSVGADPLAGGVTTSVTPGVGG